MPHSVAVDCSALRVMDVLLDCKPMISRLFRFESMSTADLPLIRRLHSDAAVMEHLGGAMNEHQVRGSLKSVLRAIDRGGWCYKIVLQEPVAIAGTIYLWPSKCNDESIHEMGWMILPEFQRQGIASAAVSTILDRARRKQAFGHIDAFPAIDNQASNRICLKSGFANLGECDFQYGNRLLRAYHWRIDQRKIVVH